MKNELKMAEDNVEKLRQDSEDAEEAGESAQCGCAGCGRAQRTLCVGGCPPLSARLARVLSGLREVALLTRRWRRRGCHREGFPLGLCRQREWCPTLHGHFALTRCAQPTPCALLVCRQVDYSVTPEDLQELFETSAGTVEKITIPTDKFKHPKGQVLMRAALGSHHPCAHLR